MLPGQIENYTIICDANKLGVTEIPKSTLGKVVDCLSKGYRYRSKRIFVLNTTFGIKMAWKVIEGFMAVHMNNKMKLSDKNTDKELLAMFHPSQLERKYGGQADNVTQYWPPIMPSNEYGHDDDLVMDQNEYEQVVADNPQLRKHPRMEVKVEPEQQIEAGIDEGAVAYELHSNFISQMEYNSSHGVIQRKSLSMAEGRRYSEVHTRIEHSVQMENSEYSNQYMDYMMENALEVRTIFPLLLMKIC